MGGYVVNIEDAAATNVNYRRVLFTAKHAQLVLMNLMPGEEIGEEVHELDQFIRFEAGEGSVILDGKTHSVSDGFAVVIPGNGVSPSCDTTALVWRLKPFDEPS